MQGVRLHNPRYPTTNTTGGANFVIGFRSELWRDISAGFGAFPMHDLSVKEVMTSIDADPYRANRDGRGRVVVAEMVTTTDIKLAEAASSASRVRS